MTELHIQRFPLRQFFKDMRIDNLMQLLGYKE